MTVELDLRTVTVTGPVSGNASGSGVDASMPSGRPSTTGEPPPAAIDRFVMGEQLGAGGMGRVYRAEDLALGRDVAIKLLNTKVVDDEEEEGLRREGQALARLAHPNVVPVFTAGVSEGRAFVAMEYVHGRTLKQWMSESPRTLDAILSTFVEAGRGLEAIHAAGLVHGDFKPSNVMVGPKGRVRLVDLGLARDLEATAPAPSKGSREVLRGTPMFMAPEVWEGGASSASSDQYSFCVALMLALDERPLRRPSPAKQEPVSRSEVLDARVPAVVRRVVQRGLAPEPGDRWPSMGHLLEALDSARHRSHGRRALARWGAASLLVALVWSGWAVEAEDEPCERGGDRLLFGVWGEPEREHLRQSVGGGSSDALTDAQEQVVARLDAHAAQLRDAHQAVCERASDESSGPGIDVAMQCLYRRRDEFHAYLQVLTANPDEPASRVLETLDGLEMVDACLSEEPGRGVEVPPWDSSRAVELRAQRGALHRIEAMSGLGRHEEALTLVEALEHDARELGHPPMLAEVLAVRGHLLRWLGKMAAAEECLEEAYFIAKSAGSDELTVRASTELMLVVGVYQGDYDEAEVWANHASATLERIESPKARARYFEMRGGLLEQQERFSEAWEAHAEALEIIEAHFGPEHPRLASGLFNAGLVLLAQRRHDEAQRFFVRCLDIVESSMGGRSTRAGTCHGALGETLRAVGRHEQAREHLRRALSIFEETLGPRSMHSLITLFDLGDVLVQVGRAEDARGIYDEAIGRWSESEQEDRRYLVRTLLARGQLDADRGDGESAEAFFERAMLVATQSKGDWRSTVIDVLFARARLSLVEGHLDEVDALVAQAEAELRPGPTWAKRAASMYDGLATELEARAEELRAREYRRRASALRSRSERVPAP